MNVSGKNVVITGVGSGIGKALAMLFASKACNLALNDVNPSRLKETITICQSINPKIHIYAQAFDVAVEELVHGFAKNALEQLGTIDVVINNAGVALGPTKVEELQKKDFDWIMGINFWGMVYGTQAFVPHLKTRKEAALINISSLFGLIGIAYQAAYCTTKFAIRGFTEALRMECLHDAPNLTIHTVHPGGVNTNIATDSKWVLKEERPSDENFNKMLVLPPEKAAQIIVRGIEKKQARILVGSDAKQGDLTQRLMPVGYTKIVWKKLAQIPEIRNMK
ncbi:MAG: SDR family NAD(P)-dependent oxidoreductase [Chitinophagales bacterium]